MKWWVTNSMLGYFKLMCIHIDINIDSGTARVITTLFKTLFHPTPDYCPRKYFWRENLMKARRVQILIRTWCLSFILVKSSWQSSMLHLSQISKWNISMFIELRNEIRHFWNVVFFDPWVWQWGLVLPIKFYEDFSLIEWTKFATVVFWLKHLLR